MINTEYTNQPDTDKKISNLSKVTAILQLAKERVRYFPQLRKKVNEAEPLTDFDFNVLQGDDGSGEYQRITNSESEVSQVIELPFVVDSEDYYTFLKSLQDIGFDLYALLSMPKGDVFSITHGSLPNLNQVLRQKSATVFRHQETHNKILKRDFLKEGQLHVRIYSGSGRTYLTAHIDPPDLKDHLSPRAQLSGQTKANYPEGEALLIETLQLLKDSINNAEFLKKEPSVGEIMRTAWGMLDQSGAQAYRDPEAYDWIVHHLFAREKIAEDLAQIVARLISSKKSNHDGEKLRVLDQAAGTGEASLALARKGFDVVATDISTEALKKIGSKASTEKVGVKTTIADFNEPLPFSDGTFDVVDTVAGNRYITNLSMFLEEVRRVLKDDGIIVWPIFASDAPLWKRAKGITQPTSSFALAKELEKHGFEVVGFDLVGSLVRNSMQGVPIYAIPTYLIARKLR